MVTVLGLNTGKAASHDPSACLVRNGQVLSFVEEERLSRVRHAPGSLPILATRRCLEIAGISDADIDVIAIGWDEPRLAARAGDPWEFTSAREFTKMLGLSRSRIPEYYFVPHHRAHAYSAFYASPFKSAGVLVVDGNGEDESISIFDAGDDGVLIRRDVWPRATSLGYMYEAVSSWLGLGRLGAGKTMGLSAYGRERSVNQLPGWISVEDDLLSSALGNDSLLDYDELMARWHNEIQHFAGASSPTLPSPELERDALAVMIASVAQIEIERAILWLANRTREITGRSELCIAGGVGLNCAANGRVPQPVYVPPVPHDAGVALGAAWAVSPPSSRQAFSAFLGSNPGKLPSDISGWTYHDLDVDRVVALVEADKIGGFCRGRAEVGPRALTHRSILASPRSSEMKSRLNATKRREQWRPFGPVAPKAGRYWEPIGELERYMVGASALTKDGLDMLPAVCHVDGTTRPQVLADADEPFVYALLAALEASGHPAALVNTSFNGPNEPLVDSAVDALACAERLSLDYVLIDDTLLIKKQAL